MKRLIMVLFDIKPLAIRMPGYPKIVETAPKSSGSFYKVNRNDPAFDRPFSELTKSY